MNRALARLLRPFKARLSRAPRRTHMASTIQINGRTYTGNNVSIINGRVMVDGVSQDEGLTGVVEVRILEGVLQDLTTDASVTCGQVLGSVKASGSVNCGAVGGTVVAGGSVNCDTVGGSINAGGSVNHG